MKIVGLWRWIYGAMFAAILVFGLIAAASDLSSLSLKTIDGLKAAFLYTMPLQLATIVLFSALERVVPAAGPRKPLKGYALNLNLTLLNRLIAPLLAGIIGAGTVALSWDSSISDSAPDTAWG